MRKNSKYIQSLQDVSDTVFIDSVDGVNTLTRCFVNEEYRLYPHFGVSGAVSFIGTCGDGSVEGHIHSSGLSNKRSYDTLLAEMDGASCPVQVKVKAPVNVVKSPGCIGYDFDTEAGGPVRYCSECGIVLELHHDSVDDSLHYLHPKADDDYGYCSIVSIDKGDDIWMEEEDMATGIGSHTSRIKGQADPFDKNEMLRYIKGWGNSSLKAKDAIWLELNRDAMNRIFEETSETAEQKAMECVPYLTSNDDEVTKFREATTMLQDAAYSDRLTDNASLDALAKIVSEHVCSDVDSVRAYKRLMTTYHNAKLSEDEYQYFRYLLDDGESKVMSANHVDSNDGDGRIWFINVRLGSKIYLLLKKDSADKWKIKPAGTTNKVKEKCLEVAKKHFECADVVTPIAEKIKDSVLNVVSEPSKAKLGHQHVKITFNLNNKVTCAQYGDWHTSWLTKMSVEDQKKAKELLKASKWNSDPTVIALLKT